MGIQSTVCKILLLRGENVSPYVRGESELKNKEKFVFGSI